jgi:predicted alpha/beta superfamily hydrolase
MHDGQNLFDEATSFSGDWRVDESMEELAGEGIEAIVVGIPNLGKERIDEYSPFPDPEHGGGGGEEYLKFIAGVVKPLIDASFRTFSGREQTFMAGSSMGGLISLYAGFRFPDLYGGVAALSPSLWFAGGAIFPFVEQAPPVESKIYIDIGTAEPRRAVHNVRRMRRLLHEKGLDAEHSLSYVEERGAGHGEQWWAGRFKGAAGWLIR